MPSMTGLSNNLKLFATSAIASPLRQLPAAMVSEIRRLALTIGASRPVTSIGVLGLESGSGTSAIASMLAFALMEADHEVIVFDASLTQAQRDLLKVETNERHGGQEPYVRLVKTAWPRLRLAVPTSDGEAGIKSALQHLNHTGAVVVLDCPALNSSSNSLEFASMADSVVLVIAAGKATKRALMECRAALNGARIRVEGLLINGAPYASGPNLP